MRRQVRSRCSIAGTIKILSAAVAFGVFLGLAMPAQAAPIASSIADFSNVQGQDDWFYGFFNRGGDSGNQTPFDTAGFEQFDFFNVPANRWEASDTQIAPPNNDFLNLGQNGGHPTGIGPGGQDEIIWAVRRYVSPVAGVFNMAIDLRKANIVNDQGGGITGRIFRDGTEIFTQLIENDDGVGVQRIITVDLSIGTILDFAIDPTGIQPIAGSDGIFSARADGSIFSAVIGVPEPATWLVLGIGLASVVVGVRYRGRQRRMLVRGRA